jgi:hypothetical protein
MHKPNNLKNFRFLMNCISHISGEKIKNFAYKTKS